MGKSFLRSMSLALTAAFTIGGAAAQEANIQGYFRVQSAQDQSIVEVRGPLTTAPDVTFDESLTKAGTVMRLRAVPQNYKGQTRYIIGNLSSQGIEVFGAPDANYLEAVMNIAADIDMGDYQAAMYSLQRNIREIGYISAGRTIIQALFEVVASRLDSEIGNLTQEQKDALGYEPGQESLQEFAQRFNREVSANIDLNAYLEPVEGTDDQYRLYFNWIDCTSVSEFYHATEQNKKSFELGFACMRQYMSNKPGLGSGETVDANDAALWKSWGFDISEKYADKYKDGIYYLTYEDIFGDHELLYNWLKMYIERFIDPAKAPNAEILGINFVDFATEMQKHQIMQGFLKYIPSIQEGQKLYLTNGRFTDGINEFSTVGTVSDNSNQFGLLGEEQAMAAGNAAIWTLLPIDENTNNYFAFNPVAYRTDKPGFDDGFLSAAYYDFPVKPVDESIKVKNIGTEVKTIELEHLGSVNYVEVSEANEVPRRTPVLFESISDNAEDNILRIVWEDQAGDYNPEAPDVAPDPEPRPEGFEVSDEEVSTQYVISRAAGASTSYGVLLSSAADASTLKNAHGIEIPAGHTAYALTTRENKISAETSKVMRTPWFTQASTIPANQAFLVSNSESAEPGISLEEPADESGDTVGINGVEVGNQQPDVIYDLQGRRVNAVKAGGIYILNGKKILVR